ncbi:cytochrome c biogenesis protein ResB [Saccharothrix algeriensis]|uniref:Cytochrome c biogenesis protein n=1 Tax=Saccharothrix algeriensis TaxID=173560 RepID=A0A8T8I882_9PSEU|nr:cytochrome c biogenesis protein ResB [Saccharothrix algeriensis]MBM7812589.1 cytochrome c biogenesis protein [Saccharothrix algeriensis]QTR06254.1 cytochrome c biogenesis protein ResB [Saccharothrix algeriensis]
MRSPTAFLRNTWRGLTAMRTALTLLFLLALGAMPGALLPQRSLNSQKVAEYITENGWWGRLLDDLQFFDVYASYWFSAVYVLLFVSLIGCLLPRTWEYYKQMRAKPVLTPRNLGRLPHHASADLALAPEAVVARARQRLRGWRLVERAEEGGARTVSAERGFLRETGNLVFHFSLLGLLVAFALGKMFGYEGQVIVQANGGQFCNSGVFNYDSFRPGLRVDGTDLNQFCVRVNDFDATYLHNGQAQTFHADIDFQSGADLVSGTWQPYPLRVNSPLRTAGDRLYLLGHGYTPLFTVTFPNGATRTGATQWRPVNEVTLASEGATKFDPPGVTDTEQRRTRQLAITGLLAPTAGFRGELLDSVFPEARDPAVAVDVYRGDLGTDSGRGQSIFSIDEEMVSEGKLVKVARQNLRQGESVTLDDGTVVRFDGVQDWVSLQVSHDPTQTWVLAFSVLVILGLGVSLTIKRRRVWVRATPQEDGRTVVEVGGLARTDQAGYGEEFTALSRDLLKEEG